MKRKKKGKLIALLLALALVVSALPSGIMTAMAEEGEAAEEQTEESVTLCDLTEGCTLEAGHEGDCVVTEASEGEEEEEGTEESSGENVTVASVQAMIDALPDEVTEENAEEVEAALDEIDEARSALYQAGGDVDSLDYTKYDAAVDALTALAGEEVSVAVAAADENVSGGISWSYVDGTLTISAADTPEEGFTSGVMDDYSWPTSNEPDSNGIYHPTAPWSELYSQVTKIVVEDGVTVLGKYAFMGMTEVTDIELADSITTINDSAFRYMTGLKSISIPDKVTTIGDRVFCQLYYS